MLFGGGLVSPFDPNQEHQPRRTQNAPEFSPAPLTIEPVKGLSTGYCLNRARSEHRILSRPLDALKARPAAKTSFCLPAHGLIRFNAENRVSRSQQLIR